MGWLSVIVLVFGLCYGTARPGKSRVAGFNKSSGRDVHALLAYLDKMAGQDSSKSQKHEISRPNAITRCERTDKEKIVNGTLAPVEWRKWFVEIWTARKFLCGGTLISPRLVLTSAHCFYKVPYFNKDPGDYCKDFHGFVAVLNNGMEYIDITRVYKNSKFATNPEYGDIYSYDEAIAVLAKSFSSYFKPAFCLSVNLKPKRSDKCYAVGVAEPDPSIRKKKKYVHRGLVDILGCKSFEKNIPDYFFEILCTTTGGNKGDSGGPVLCYADETESEMMPYIMGIISKVDVKVGTIVHNTMRRSERWIEDFLRSSDEHGYMLDSCVQWEK